MQSRLTGKKSSVNLILSFSLGGICFSVVALVVGLVLVFDSMNQFLHLFLMFLHLILGFACCCLLSFLQETESLVLSQGCGFGWIVY